MCLQYEIFFFAAVCPFRCNSAWEKTDLQGFCCVINRSQQYAMVLKSFFFTLLGLGLYGSVSWILINCGFGFCLKGFFKMCCLDLWKFVAMCLWYRIPNYTKTMFLPPNFVLSIMCHGRNTTLEIFILWVGRKEN